METQKSDEQCAASDKNKKEKAEAEAEAGSRGERNKAIKSQSDCPWLPCPALSRPKNQTHIQRERERETGEKGRSQRELP